MKKSIVISVMVVLVVLLVGYFLISNKEGPSGDTKVIKSEKDEGYNGEVSELILPINDLEGYKIAERSPRTKSEISDEGISRGWLEGYYIKYLKGSEENILDVSRIELFISRYPLENVSQSIELGYVEIEGYTAEALPDPRIGQGSIATRYTDNEWGLRDYRIEFYKKDILITLINGGATTDYESLKELAKKVADKI